MTPPTPQTEILYPTDFPTDPAERAAIEAEAKRLFSPTLLDTSSTLTCDWVTCMQVARVVMGERETLRPKPQTTDKPFEPTSERLIYKTAAMLAGVEEEVFKHRFLVEQMHYRSAAEVYLRDLSTLRSQLDAAKDDSTSWEAAVLTARIQLKEAYGRIDALKASAVIKNDAIRRTLKYLRSPEDESAEMIERVLVTAEEAGR